MIYEFNFKSEIPIILFFKNVIGEIFLEVVFIKSKDCNFFILNLKEDDLIMLSKIKRGYILLRIAELLL